MLKCALFLPLLGPPRVLGRWLQPGSWPCHLKKASNAGGKQRLFRQPFCESILESQHTWYSIIPCPMMWRCGLTRPLQHCRQRLHCTCEHVSLPSALLRRKNGERGASGEGINISGIPWRPTNFTGPASRAGNISCSVFVTHHVHAVARARPKQMAWPPL